MAGPLGSPARHALPPAPALPISWFMAMFQLATDYPPPLDESRRQRHKFMNGLHTWALLVGSVGILALSAWLLAGEEGILWTVIGGGITLWSASRVSPDLILRFYRARPLPAHVFPEGNRMVEALAAKAGLETPPRLHYVPSWNMNAFAVGSSANAAIAVTDGLIRGLTLRQFAGVIAHEISHIRNGDLKVMALADMVARMTSLMSSVGLVMAFFYLLAGTAAPWLGILVLIAARTMGGLMQLALSRAREYDADLDAVGLTGDPEGLASALATLERRQGALWEQIMVPGGRIPDPSLLRTHPKTSDRIERLLSLRKPGALPAFGVHGTSVPVIPPEFSRVRRYPGYHRTGAWY